MLIKNADTFSGIAREIDCWTRRDGGTKPLGNITSACLLCSTIEWRILSELLVRTATLKIFGNAIASSDHGTSIEAGRRPRKPEPRQPVPNTHVVLAKSTRIPILPRQLNGSGP